MARKFIYKPIGFDRFDPKVISGHAIKEGSVVKITKENLDPRNMFVWIKDERGNEQSVDKRSLKKLKSVM